MKETPKLTLNRDYVLATTKGHVIEFKKNVPTHVPFAVFPEALGIGAVPAEGADLSALEESKVEKAPADPAERNPLISAAIEKIVAKNEREDFTAAGSPTVEAVSKELGFKVAGREIATMWQEYHEKKAAQ